MLEQQQLCTMKIFLSLYLVENSLLLLSLAHFGVLSLLCELFQHFFPPHFMLISHFSFTHFVQAEFSAFIFARWKMIKKALVRSHKSLLLPAAATENGRKVFPFLFDLF